MKRTLFLILLSTYSISVFAMQGEKAPQFSWQEEGALSSAQYRQALNQLLDATPATPQNEHYRKEMPGTTKRSSKEEVIEATLTTVAGVAAMLYFGCNFDGTCSNASLCSWLSSFFG